MTPEQERQMLELAAKAAGIKGDYRTVVNDTWDESGNLKYWNPLTDDGDCARLEAQLDIDVGWRSDYVNAWHVYSCAGESYADHAGDKQAARRLAVVRVAAEIGRRMKS